jgi:hypothetical protein
MMEILIRSDEPTVDLYMITVKLVGFEAALNILAKNTFIIGLFNCVDTG